LTSSAAAAAPARTSRRESGLADDFKSQARRVLARLERGLGDYPES
jgi:hypothetical protein